MPPTRRPNDPFNPLHPMQPIPTLRPQLSHQSLRATAAAQPRARQQRDFLAPALSRRPTSRSTPRAEDEVLADSDSEPELTAAQVQRIQRRPVRRVRPGSPEVKHGRGKTRQVLAEEREFVVRQADGNYLLGASGFGEGAVVPIMSEEDAEEHRLEEADTEMAAQARLYFQSGAHMDGKLGSKVDDEEHNQELMIRLRELVTEKIEGERWRYEATDRFQAPYTMS